jgi:hypothetical protein
VEVLFMPKEIAAIIAIVGLTFGAYKTWRNDEQD